MKKALSMFVPLILLLLAGLTACGNSTQKMTVTISGRVTANGTGLQGVTLTLGGMSSTATTDSKGDYQLEVPANNTYTITPAKAGYSFAPASRTITVSNADSAGNDFTATSGMDFTALMGTWTGRWNNTTYGTTGAAGLVVTSPSANAIHTVLTLSGNVFGGAAPGPISLDASITAGSSTVSFTSAGTEIGDISATIGSDGAIAATVTNVPNPSISRVDVTGTVTSNSIDCAYTITFTAGGTAAGTLNLTK